MSITTYGDISQRTASWAAAKMLSHAEPIIVLGKFGLTKPIPKNTAKQAKFRRAIPFTVSTTQLAEGVTPASKKMQYEDVTANLGQYGGWTELTDVVADTAEDPVLDDMSQLCGEDAAETVEMVCYGILKAGTSVYYANGSARTDVNTAVSINKLRGVTRYLDGQRAKPITKMMSGSPDYQTTPVEGGYVAFCHTDCKADLRNLNGFTPVAKYGTRQQLHPKEFGTVEDLRFIASPLLTPWEDGGGNMGSMKSTSGVKADVYPIIIVASEAYGHTPLKGAGAIKPMVLNPNTPRGGDPLGQRGSVSWKTYYTAIRLNETWMSRLEVAVTDL